MQHINNELNKLRNKMLFLNLETPFKKTFYKKSFIFTFILFLFSLMESISSIINKSNWFFIFFIVLLITIGFIVVQKCNFLEEVNHIKRNVKYKIDALKEFFFLQETLEKDTEKEDEEYLLFKIKHEFEDTNSKEIKNILAFFIKIGFLTQQEKNNILEKNKELFLTRSYNNFLIEILKEIKLMNKENIENLFLQKQKQEEIERLKQEIINENDFNQLKQIG